MHRNIAERLLFRRYRSCRSSNFTYAYALLCNASGCWLATLQAINDPYCRAACLYPTRSVFVAVCPQLAYCSSHERRCLPVLRLSDRLSRLSRSLTLLKPFVEFKCHFAGSHVGPRTDCVRWVPYYFQRKKNFES